MKPILFNTEMVKAILDGRKTVTRRLVKPQPNFRDGETGTPVRCDDESWCFKIDQYSDIYDFELYPPAYRGDILYVRETWGYNRDMWLYKANYREDEWPLFRWHPSIHMPKKVARIFLRVKDVRLERLQDITEEQAIREGCVGVPCDCINRSVVGGILCCTDCYNSGWIEPPSLDFCYLWDSTIKKADLPTYGWYANPWVWVIEFERCEKPKEK